MELWLAKFNPQKEPVKKNYNLEKNSNLSEDQGVLSIKQHRISQKVIEK